MKYIPLIGRILFSLIFMYSSIVMFSSDYVYQAEIKGVPLAFILIPFAGILQLVGTLSILFGFMAKWGAWIVIIFLIPVSLIINSFWKIDDPMLHQLESLTFMKNMSIIGGALMIAYFGSGPYSIDEWKADKKAKKKRA
ncbi:DoxX family protein [Flavobacterium sp. '19STA2R22 D10 B1']|uniref:DoxX family protein n=1 Tax=Flavobacterium aerium TaxID=3037261 RepID=UPI00278C1A53|nr:DoxX family protein [Flavobacterium sp. '19STA2R22 D10 B1']